MLRLYDSRLSGNAWKVRILLNQLGIPFERVTLDLAKGATADAGIPRQEPFRPHSRARAGGWPHHRGIGGDPALSGGRHAPCCRTIAIFAPKSSSWLTFEQADLLRALALPRFYTMRGMAEQMKSRIADFQEGAYLALAKLDDWLATHDWLVDDRYTVADIGMFGYVVDGARREDTTWRGFRRSARGSSGCEAQPGWIPLLEEAAA